MNTYKCCLKGYMMTLYADNLYYARAEAIKIFGVNGYHCYIQRIYKTH